MKGYNKKTPFIYGIDYTTYDITIYILVLSENYFAMKQFFTKPKNAVVCDDNKSI